MGELRQSVKVGKLNLVDLAGSERVHITGATGHFMPFPPPPPPPLPPPPPSPFPLLLSPLSFPLPSLAWVVTLEQISKGHLCVLT